MTIIHKDAVFEFTEQQILEFVMAYIDVYHNHVAKMIYNTSVSSYNENRFPIITEFSKVHIVCDGDNELMASISDSHFYSGPFCMFFDRARVRTWPDSAITSYVASISLKPYLDEIQYMKSMVSL